MASLHTSTYFADYVLPLEPSHAMYRLWRQLWQPELTVDLFHRRQFTSLRELNGRRSQLFWVMRLPGELPAWTSGQSGIQEILVRNEYLAIITDLLSFSAGTRDWFPLPPQSPSGNDGYTQFSPDYPGPVPPNSPAFLNPFSGQTSALSATTDSKGAVVFGNPGTGKSAFICLTLVLRLQARLPTIYQTEPYSAIFFTDDGVFEIKHTPKGCLLSDINIDRHRQVIPPSTWCLVDSTGSCEQVPSFIANLPCFIIQAASPQASGLKWKTIHRRSIVTFIMQPWSLQEIIFGATLQDPTDSHPLEEELIYFYERFGASVKECYRQAKQEPRTKAYESALRRSIAKLDLHTIEKMFQEVASLDAAPDSVAYQLFSIAPGPTRTDAQADIWTRFLYQMLRPIFMAYNKFDAHGLYRTLVTTTATPKKFTSYLYRDAVIDMFTRGGQWPVELTKETERTYLRIGYSKHTVMLSKKLLPEHSVFHRLQSFEYDPEEDIALANGVYWPKYESEDTYGPFIYDKQSNLAMVFHTMVAPKEEVRDAVFILLQSIGVQSFFDVLVTPTPAVTDIQSFKQPTSEWEGPMDAHVMKFRLFWDPADLQATRGQPDIEYVDIPNSDKGDWLASKPKRYLTHVSITGMLALSQPKKRTANSSH